MNNEKIEDNELLYRVSKKSNPDCWLANKPMPAFFIDSSGASIDRDGNRNEKEIEIQFRNRFERHNEFGGLVKIRAKTCRNVKTVPKAIHNKKHKHHGEIHNSETEVEIEYLKALQLADMCDVVCYNDLME